MPETDPRILTKPSYCPAARPDAVKLTGTLADWPGCTVSVVVPRAGAGAPLSRGLTVNEYVSAAVPTLEIVRVFDASRVEPPYRKLSDVGAAAKVDCSAALMSSNPAPDCCTRAVMGAAVL